MPNVTLFDYATLGIMIGGTAPNSASFESASVLPINGVRSSTTNLGYPRQDIVDFAGGGEPTLVGRPTANLEFSYIFSQGVNERAMGFVFNSTVPALTNLNNERNYYSLINQVGADLIGYSGGNTFTMAFGNGVITKYTLQAAVSQLTTCTVNVECLNLLIQGTGSGNILPYIDKQSGAPSTGVYSLPPFSQTTVNAKECSPSNIVLTFASGSAIGAALSGNLSCPLQTFSFSIDMARNPSQNVGWAYPATRAIRWPVTVSIHADAYLNGIQADALNRLNCGDSGWAFNVGFINSGGFNELTSFTFTNVKLDSQTFTSTIGSSTRVSMDWTAKIYDPNRISGTASNFFINYPQTAYNQIIFSGANWNTGAGAPTSLLNLNQYVYLSVLKGAAVLNGNVVSITNESANQITLQYNVSGSTEVGQIVTTVQ